MTKQEAFDTVLSKVKEHGFGWDAKARQCRYLTEDGKRCAIGWLASEEVLQQIKNELCSFDSLSRDIKESFGLDFAFLQSLQTAHDNGAELGVRVFQDGMRVVATKYALEYKNDSN